MKTVHFFSNGLRYLYPISQACFLHTLITNFPSNVGIYPYEHSVSTKQLAESGLPGIQAFFSKVSNSGVSPEDYEHAKTVYRVFQCSNLLSYTQLYCKTDVLLLCIAFLSFRQEVRHRF